MTQVSEYTQQANDFLTKTNTTFKAEFLKHGKHFADDKDTRDIYKITLVRGSREYSFNFGQSINNSGEYQLVEHLRNKVIAEPLIKQFGSKYAFNKKDLKTIFFLTTINEKEIIKNPNFSPPASCDVLACLTKYDPGTFEDFCGEFGYDTYSKKAEKTYLAVKDEWLNMSRLFNDDELSQLQEIQ